MTAKEVKEQLSKYYILCREIECVRKRIEKLKAMQPTESDLMARLEELNTLYKNAVLNADNALASVFELINKLDNTDGDADVLKKYHIDGLSEKIIAKQMCLSVDYIRTKRWRSYKKIAKQV